MSTGKASTGTASRAIAGAVGIAMFCMTAEANGDPAQCRTIPTADERLRCYDQAFAPVPAETAAVTKVEVIDLKLDASTLAGRHVEVAGWMNEFNNHWTLHALGGSGTSFYVDTSFLSREHLKDLMTTCGAYGKCTVTLKGTVNKVDFGEWGVIADSVKVAPWDRLTPP